MTEQNKPKFGLTGAKRSSNLVMQLTPEDVRRFRPAWSVAEAEQFLQQHKVKIAKVLLETGLSALVILIATHESEARHD